MEVNTITLKLKSIDFKGTNFNSFSSCAISKAARRHFGLSDWSDENENICEFMDRLNVWEKRHI